MRLRPACGARGASAAGKGERLGISTASSFAVTGLQSNDEPASRLERCSHRSAAVVGRDRGCGSCSGAVIGRGGGWCNRLKTIGYRQPSAGRDCGCCHSSEGVVGRVHGWVGGAGLLPPLRIAALEEGRRAAGAAEALRVSGGEVRSVMLGLFAMVPTRPPPLLRLLASPLPLLPPAVVTYNLRRR